MKRKNGKQLLKAEKTKMKNLLTILILLLVGLNGFGQENKFNGTGYHESTNVYGQISKKGYFKNYQLLDGLFYKYD